MAQKTVKRIGVFCGSSGGRREIYTTAAARLGRHLAAAGIGIVYGGGKVGLMGTLADAMLEAGGDVTGVMPEALVAREIAHRGLRDLRVVKSMHERKALMAELADAFVAMPGGYGTFEEFCEILTWTQLGLQRKPCGLLNVDGYYDALLGLFDHAVGEGFLKPVHREMVLAESEPEKLVAQLLDYNLPFVDKWTDRDET